jgi:hypothetical protein
MFIFHVFQLGEVLEGMVCNLASQLKFRKESVKEDGTRIIEYDVPEEEAKKFGKELVTTKVFTPN